MTDEIAKATQQAMILEKAIKRATTDKGISYYSLNAELQKAGTSAAKLTATLASGGQQFAASLNAANVALAQSDRTLISLSAKIKEMSRVMVQSFKFTAAQTTLQAISNAAREAYQWVYDLDKTITNIGVVTGYTGDQLDKVTQNAIAGAKELRIAANDYAEGALIFYQQGLGDDEVARRVEITAKSARAAGQSLEQMSSQLTAIWNTYQMTGDEMERAASVGAKMAGDTAVDFADIAEAMQTAAAPAEQMGVSYNSLAAIIATVGDTTQQSASVIGNAFKTIFSRFQQLKAEGTDGEVTLNRVSSQLQSLGINVLDASGELRNLDTVIMEVGTQWDSWSQKQQLAVAQLVGGTRQYGQFLTLMQNFDKYQDLLQSANAEDGSALEQQYASSLDSIESRAENAGEAWRRAFGSLIDTDMIKDVLSAVEAVGNGLDQVFNILGDTKGVALYIATIFAKQWIPSIAQAATNLKTLATNFTPEQREKNINKQYDENNRVLNIREQASSNPEEQRSLQLQKQKNEFGRQTAIINDKINTSLKTANSYQQILLNYQKDSLKYAQNQYQSALDRLNILQQEAEKQQNLLSVEEQQAIAEERKAQAILQGYQNRLAEAQSRGPTEDEYKDAVATKGRQDASPEEIAAADKIITSYNEKLKECARLADKVAQAQDRAFEAGIMRNAAQETTKLQQSFLQAESTVTKFGLKGQKSSKQAAEAVQKFNEKVREAAKDSDVMQKMLEEMGIPKEITNRNLKYLEQMLAKLEDIVEAGEKATEVMKDTNAEGVDATEERNSAENRTIEAGRNTSPPSSPDNEEEESPTPQKIDFTGVITGAVQAASAIGSFGMIASSVFSTLQDDSASVGDKFFAIATAIGFAIPMITSMNTAVIALGNAFKLEAAAQEGANAVTVISAAMSTLLAKAKGALTLSSIKEAASAAGAAIAHGAQAVAAGIATVATQGLTISIGTLTLTFPPLLVIVLAVVAAFAALVAIIKAVQFIFNLLAKNELKESLNEAKESAEMFASALEDAKTEAEALKSAFDGYEDVKKTLDECAQGTQEWEDALKAVNDQVLQLISDYPELAGMVNEQGEKAITRNETTGELEVADWAMEQMENEANKKVQNTQAASIHANQNVREAELAISKQDAGMSFASNDALTALAENGEVFGLTGEDLTNKIAEIFKQNGIEGNAQQYAAAIEKNTEAAIALAQEVRSNTIATETENDVLGQAALEGTDYEGTDLAMSQAGTQYDAAYDKAYEEEMDRLSTNFFGVADQSFKDAFAEYQAGMLSDYENLEVTNYKKNGDVDIKYTDENGDEQTETIKAEDIAKFNAGAKAAENLGVSMESLDTDVQNLSNSTNDVTQANEAAATAITEGDLGSLTKDQLDDLKAVATSPEEMSKYLQSQGMSQANADIYGQELYEQVNAIDWDEILEGINIPDSVLDNFTTEQAQNLGKAYEKIGEIGGEEMQGTMDTIITEAEKMGLGDEVAEKLGEVDFTSWESIEEFEDYLNSIGLDFNALGIDLDDFTDQLQNADGVLRSVDPVAVAEKYASIFDFAKDLKIGDTITEDQFNMLDDNMKTFFTDMGDGTYQLTKSAEDFLTTVQENERQALMDEAEKAMQNYETAQNADYTSEEEKQSAIDMNYDSLVQAQTAVLATATSLSELDMVMEQLQMEMGETGVSSQAYSAALMNLASQFDNTTKEVEEYQLALLSGDEAQIAAAEDAVRGATLIGEAAEKYGLETDTLEAQAKQLAKAYDMSAEEAARVATNNQRMNKGISQLAENWEDWSDTLQNTDKTSQDYAEVVADLTETLGDLTGAADDFEIPEGFLDSEENLRLIGEAAQGSQEAINQLGNALAYAAVDAMTFNAELAASLGSNIDATQFETYKNTVLTGIDQLKGKLGELEVGQDVASILGDDWVTALNEMALATGMSVDQMNGLLGQLGVQTKVETKTVDQEMEVPMYAEMVEPAEVTVWEDDPESPDGGHYVTRHTWNHYTVPNGTKKVMGKVQVAQISTEENGMTPEITWTGTGGGNAAGYSPRSSGTGSKPSGGGGGGGGSKAPEKKDDPGKRERLTVEDRYSTVQAAIDDVQRSLDKLDDTASDMWGGPKLAALRKYNKELWQQGDNLQRMLELTEKYKKEDSAAAIASQVGLEKTLGGQITDLQFNDDGFIANRTEVITDIDNLLQAAWDEYYQELMKFNAAVDNGTATEEMSNKVDELKDHYDDLDEAAQNYIKDMDLSDETAQKYIDTLNDLVELIRTEISNRIETITYRIELRTDMNDLEIENLERSIEHLGDVGILTGSKIGLLGDVFGKAKDNAWEAVGGFNSLVEVLNNLNSAAGQEYFIEKYGQEAWDEYSKNGILPEELVSGLQSYISDMMSSVDDMYSKMEDMFDTYLDLLDMYADKFDQIADKLNLNASKLDVYQELLEFSGQQYNGRQGQEARKAIADARISTSRTNLELSQAKFETYKEQYDEWMQQVEDFQAVHGDDIASYDEATAAAWNKIDETRQELYNGMQESEEEIYSNMSELVQNVADAIEVGAQIIKEQVVESLDGLFNDFASMTETWDQMETLRLFFLEDYDKTYQLDSLLRDVNEAMEDVTDPERMNEYLALVEEINAANQEGIDMTQTDVDLLKAKFELQKAQDAYEEQMNAKTTMRLARDASGNWNYVYSDDTSQTEDAVQALADAQYNYDKLLHEARDESSQLWLQTQQEFFEWQEQIDQSRLEWDTAYREQVQRTYDYYLALTERYAGQVEKYNEMLGDSYSDTTLGIITNYDSMEAAQQAYTEQHAIYHTKLEENTKQYQGVVDEATDIIGMDYDNMASEVYGAAQEIMSTNSVLEGDIWDLQATASSALSAMSADVWANVNSMISAIQALEAEIQAALALLRQLTEESTNGGNTAFDANRDYTATGYNYLIDYAKSIGKDVNELTRQDVDNAFSTEQGKLIAEEFGNKTSDEGLYGKTDWYNGETAEDFVDNMYDAVKNGVIDGQKEYDEGDTSEPANQVGDKGSWYNDRYGTPRTASGGLIRTPQVRSVAEDGAELILNSTDTQNILDAVRNMREVVRMRMSSMNTDIAKKTESNAEKTVINKDIQQVDQTVSIDATFPNVSVAAEIEEALNNLINQAVQYATRNNR